MVHNFKHVIWDWNGTLFNDTELCLNIINGLLVRHELKKLSLEDYRFIFTFPVKEYYAKAGLDFTKYSFEVLGKEWMDEYEERKSECHLFEGVKDVLRSLHGNKIEQSILSAYSHHTLVTIVKYYGLSDFFRNISGLDHIYATSKVDIGRELIKKIDLPGDEIVLIGDTIHDYEVAKELGINSILIANGHQSRARLLDCGVPVLDDIRELVK